MRTPHLLRTATPGLLSLLTLAPIAACTDEPVVDPGTEVTSGAYHGYVQRGWIVPSDTNPASRLGHDFTGDGQIDNRSGMIMGLLQSFELDFAGSSRAAFAAGEVVALHQLRADALVDDATVEWRTFDGTSGIAPRFDGSDRLAIGAETGTLYGMIVNGRAELAGHRTTVALPFFPGQSPIWFPLADVRMSVDLAGRRCQGVLSGLIDQVDVEELVMPNLAAQMILHIATHPGSPMAAEAMEIFDEDADGRLTVDELVHGDVMPFLLTPDVDTDGDGDRDAVSFGLGFDCTPATLIPSGQ